MWTSRRAPALVSALMVGLVGCGGSMPPPTRSDAASAAPEAPTRASEAAPIQPTPDRSARGSSLDRIMRAHFEEALMIRQAVIAGTPERAAEPASALAHARDMDQLPEGWRGFVERMQEVASRLEDSVLISRAASATADLGVACGMCHQQRGGPLASTERAPAEGTTLDSRMQRHVWATERLWEGLYVPSDDAWNLGAAALSAAPFPSEVLNEGGVYARTAAADLARLVGKASERRTLLDRASLYAELLLTCGSCHRATRVTH